MERVKDEKRMTEEKIEERKVKTREEEGDLCRSD